MYHHGERAYETHRTLINLHLEQLKIKTIPLTYHDLFARFHNMKTNKDGTIDYLAYGKNRMYEQQDYNVPRECNFVTIPQLAHQSLCDKKKTKYLPHKGKKNSLLDTYSPQLLDPQAPVFKPRMTGHGNGTYPTDIEEEAETTMLTGFGYTVLQIEALRQQRIQRAHMVTVARWQEQDRLEREAQQAEAINREIRGNPTFARFFSPPISVTFEPNPQPYTLPEFWQDLKTTAKDIYSQHKWKPVLFILPLLLVNLFMISTAPTTIPEYRCMTFSDPGFCYSSLYKDTFTANIVCDDKFDHCLYAPPRPPVLAHMQQEQTTKSLKGVVSGVLEGSSTIASSIQSLPVVGQVASKAAPILSILSKFAKSVGLDYPNSVKALEPVVIKQTPQLNFAKGLDLVNSLGMDPANQVSNRTDFFCDKGPSPNMFENYKLLPGLMNVNNFDGTFTQNQVIITIPIHPSVCAQSVFPDNYALTPIANMSAFFRYWKGSIKFYFMFTTSKFVSARVRFEWHPQPSDSSGLTNSDVGDILSTTIDICGDTNVPICIPYLKDLPWLPVVTPDIVAPNSAFSGWTEVANGCLVVRVVNPPIVANSISDTVIDYAIWISGGEDFDFARPQDDPSTIFYSPFAVELSSSEKPRMKAHMSTCTSIQSVFKSTFLPIVPCTQRVCDNILQGERVVSFTELFHRYSQFPILSGSSAYNSWTLNPWFPLGTSFTQFDRFMMSFMFHRGNFRWKFLNALNISSDNRGDITLAVGNAVSAPYATAEHHGDAYGARSGIAFEELEFNQWITAETPMYGMFPMHSIHCSAEIYELPCVELQANSKAGSSHSYKFIPYLAVGDNFSVGQLQSPGYFIVGTHPLKKNIKAHMQSNMDERKPIEVTDQQVSELTSFRDTVTGSEVVNHKTTPIHANTDPYADQGLTQVLSRPYITHSFQWDSTQTYNHQLARGNLPNDLFNITSIDEKLARFKYFRSACKVDIRVNSTTFHSGKILCVFAPHWNVSNSTGVMSNDDMYSLSCLNSVIISANSNEPVSFEIPYVCPSAYFDLQHTCAIGDVYEGFFGTWQMYVLSPLRLTGATSTASLTVTVYQNFVNPEPAGFTRVNIDSLRYQRKSKGVATNLSQKSSFSLSLNRNK